MKEQGGNKMDETKENVRQVEEIDAIQLAKTVEGAYTDLIVLCAMTDYGTIGSADNIQRYFSSLKEVITLLDRYSQVTGEEYSVGQEGIVPALQESISKVHTNLSWTRRLMSSVRKDDKQTPQAFTNYQQSLNGLLAEYQERTGESHPLLQEGAGDSCEVGTLVGCFA